MWEISEIYPWKKPWHAWEKRVTFHEMPNMLDIRFCLFCKSCKLTEAASASSWQRAASRPWQAWAICPRGSSRLQAGSGGEPWTTCWGAGGRPWGQLRGEDRGDCGKARDSTAPSHYSTVLPKHIKIPPNDFWMADCPCFGQCGSSDTKCTQ